MSTAYIDLELLSRSASGQWHRLSDDGHRLECTRDQVRDTDRRKTLREVDPDDLCTACFAGLCRCREHLDEQPCPYATGVHSG